MGDTDQLPPIGPGRALADLVESDAAPRVHLTAIYRQAARSLIVRSARRINDGRPPFLSLAEAHAELGEQELDEDFVWISRRAPRPCVRRCSSWPARRCRGAASTRAPR